MPFDIFQQLLNRDSGDVLRQKCIKLRAMDLVLNCLGVFTHQPQIYLLPTDVNKVTFAMSIILILRSDSHPDAGSSEIGYTTQCGKTGHA